MVGAIVLFWLASTGYLLHREWWQHYFTDAPPQLTIDLADEATTVQPSTRWLLFRNGKEVGRASTRMNYVPDSDTFELHSELRQVELVYSVLAALTLKAQVPAFNTMQRVTRAGELREVVAEGNLACSAGTGPLSLFDLKMTVNLHGIVMSDQRIHWEIVLDTSMGQFAPQIEPTPVPSGSVLNPLQPLSRIRGLRPGQRWQLTLVDPLSDALAAALPQVMEQVGGTKMKLPFSNTPKVLRAQVSTSLQPIETLKEPLNCWVIDYYAGETLLAKTWVEDGSGRVLRQEAFQLNEHLVLDREDVVTRAVQP